ncbi:MAG: hypothetical protein ACR9NN_05700 [Nostochopsis sp.]
MLNSLFSVRDRQIDKLYLSTKSIRRGQWSFELTNQQSHDYEKLWKCQILCKYYAKHRAYLAVSK